ncbi:MAG: hypothetical protein KZY74_15630 [Paenibacillaceae bacterium]|nr:hypothetical protein [Paenibacillaceae bacterium]
MDDATGGYIGNDSPGKPTEANGDHPDFGFFKTCTFGGRNGTVNEKREKPLFEKSFGRAYPNRQ